MSEGLSKNSRKAITKTAVKTAAGLTQSSGEKTTSPTLEGNLGNYLSEKNLILKT